MTDLAKHVLVANEVVAELMANPSQPVTVEIRETAPDGRLDMVFRTFTPPPAPRAEGECDCAVSRCLHEKTCASLCGSRERP